MGKGLRTHRRTATAKIGALVAVLVLALLVVPTVAFAAYSSTYSVARPAPGSSTTVTQPTISVLVYNKYGSNGKDTKILKVDNVRVTPTVEYIAGWGKKKFRVSYVPASPLSLGVHTAWLQVKDLKGNISTYSWSFTVADGIAPVTTSDVVDEYLSSATIHLMASDNVGVAHTYYQLNNGPVMTGTTVVSDKAGANLLQFWSVDTAGNVEAKKVVLFTIVNPPVNSHALPEISCTNGCHDELDIASLHLNEGVLCVVCHGPGVTPTNQCNSEACHGNSPDYHTNDTHPVIESDGETNCRASGCHGDEGVIALHKGDCFLCHSQGPDRKGLDPAYVSFVKCQWCHGDDFDAIHPDPGNSHDVTNSGQSSACFATCHPQNAADIHTTWANPPGCIVCHAPDVTPTVQCAACHDNISTVHLFPHPDASGDKSSACTSCHGSDLPQVHQRFNNCICHTATWLSAEMGELLDRWNDGEGTAAQCVDCHEGEYAAHGFDMGVSGHNTTTYGKVGAYSKFDGSQGPVLMWESEIASDALQPSWTVESGFQNATAPDGVTSLYIGQEGTVTTNWNFPTANVFWQQGDPSAPADAMFLDEDSVITCQDCHAGLNAAGPHGASDNWGIDPDYPADLDYAELTKQVQTYPSGIKMRSTLTTATQTYSSGMGLICSKCHDLQNLNSGTTANSPLPMYSVGSAQFTHDGDTFTPVWYVTSRSSSWTVFTDAAGHPVDGSTVATRQAQAWSQAATGSLNTNAIGSSNTAHSSHHQDTNDGSAQCVGCHVAVPHGWKAPRLLVNSGWDGSASAIGAGVIAGDEAPYRSPNLLGTSRTNGGIAINPATGYNRMGMLTLSAVDNHGLNAGGLIFYSGAITQNYQTGAAYWSEASCQACNDHSGEDGIRIITSGGAPE